MKLSGSRVSLREFRSSDTQAVNAIDGDDRVTYWLSFGSRTPDQTRTFLDGVVERAAQEPRTEYYLAATLPGEDTRVVGFVRLALDGVKAAKLGFAVHADHWGQGVATDAAATIAGFGFGELGLHRISCAIGPENKPSVRVVQKLGMIYEGCIRDHVFTNGAWRDSLLYSVLESEWKQVQSRDR